MLLAAVFVLGGAMGLLQLAGHAHVAPTASFTASVAHRLMPWVVWACLFPLLTTLTERWHRLPWGGLLRRHVVGLMVGGSLVALVNAAAWWVFKWGGPEAGFGELLLRNWRELLLGNVIAYAVLTGFGHALAHLGDLRGTEEALRRSQEQLFQAQKMEAVGRLAGGIAHDFNNLLTVITNYTSLVAEGLSDDDPGREDLLEVRKASERAASLTRQLLAFSRRQVMQPKVLDLHAVVGDIAGMLRRLIGEDITLEVRPRPAGLGYALADPVQVEQILLNLVVNARDAIQGGGKITIECANADLDHTFARLHEGARPGSYLMLVVADTGMGMDAETQRRIFEPFFTTKEQGRGTGLGLATVYGIVKQSGGYIAVYSEVGHGTVFRVYLPRSGAEQPTPLIPPPATHHPSGHGTILLVEDEENVRRLVAKVLERQGYEVLTATDGRSGEARAAEYDGPIDLILTDVVMPHCSGPELVGRLKLSHPEARVVYMSGYTDDALAARGVLGPAATFLPKPFSTKDLLRTVRDALPAGAPLETAGAH
jgi:two-component system cell cycle sensor histidine kinase/response regulator CckA